MGLLDPAPPPFEDPVPFFLRAPEAEDAAEAEHEREAKPGDHDRRPVEEITYWNGWKQTS